MGSDLRRHSWAAGIHLVGAGHPCTVHVFPKDPELPTYLHTYMYVCMHVGSLPRSLGCVCLPACSQ